MKLALSLIGKKLGSNTTEFERTFTEQSLGMKIFSDSMKRAIVEQVLPNSAAESLEIQNGDVILAVEGQPVTSFDDFMAIISAIERPVTIRFFMFPTKLVLIL